MQTNLDKISTVVNLLKENGVKCFTFDGKSECAQASFGAGVEFGKGFIKAYKYYNNTYGFLGYRVECGTIEYTFDDNDIVLSQSIKATKEALTEGRIYIVVDPRSATYELHTLTEVEFGLVKYGLNKLSERLGDKSIMLAIKEPKELGVDF